MFSYLPNRSRGVSESARNTGPGVQTRKGWWAPGLCSTGKVGRERGKTEGRNGNENGEERGRHRAAGGAVVLGGEGLGGPSEESDGKSRGTEAGRGHSGSRDQTQTGRGCFLDTLQKPKELGNKWEHTRARNKNLINERRKETEERNNANHSLALIKDCRRCFLGVRRSERKSLGEGGVEIQW